MKIRIFGIQVIIGMMFFCGLLSAQIVDSPKDPAAAKLVYQDLENFVEALERLKPGSDSAAILQKHYIDRGTPGLKIFLEKYPFTAERLSKAIVKYPLDYHAVQTKMQWIKSQEDSIRQYFGKFRQFIPGAVFPPTYYLVDIRRGIGSGSTEGQLITIEKEAKKIVDPGLKSHIIHELVHLNQLHAIGSLEKYLAIYRDEKSLLAITIREGIAEFFCELITGQYTQQQAYFYARAHERRLWQEFKNEMHGKETGQWMWTAPANPEQPRDLAYVFGALITESYYKSAMDLEIAVKEILSTTDYDLFLEKSGYDKKFIEQ